MATSFPLPEVAVGRCRATPRRPWKRGAGSRGGAAQSREPSPGAAASGTGEAVLGAGLGERRGGSGSGEAVGANERLCASVGGTCGAAARPAGRCLCPGTGWAGPAWVPLRGDRFLGRLDG